MKKGLRGVLAIVLAALLGVAPGAQAAFSPGLDAIMSGDAITLTLTGQVEQAAAMSEASLAVLNDWLGRIRLTLSSSETDALRLSRGEATYDGNPLLSIATLAQPEQTVTSFEHAGTAYLTAPDQPDALTLLAGTGDGLPQLTLLPDAYVQGAEALYACLAEKATPKYSKSSTSIRNAAASAAYETYTFKADEMNAAWPDIFARIWPMLEPALQDMPETKAALRETLSGLTFSGECRFKRFLDKAGGDMGLQFTGNAARGEDKRKVTLFGGFTPDRGGYLSLALPATKGKNNTKLTVSWKQTEKNGQHTLTLALDCTDTYDGETRNASLDVSLKNSIKDSAESWTGTVSLSVQEPGADKCQWQLKPALTLDAAGLHGDISLLRKDKNKTTLQAALQMSLSDGEIRLPDAGTAQDLRGLDTESAQAIVSREMQPLSLALMRLMAALPEESRALLLHELRTDAWMTGPSVGLDGSLPPAEDAQTPSGDWIVKEEENQ